MVFVDTNVLVYATAVEAPLHATASAALRDLSAQGEELWISRQVVREYIVALSRPQPWSAPLPPGELVRRAELWEARCRVADEDAEVAARLKVLVRQVPLGGKQVHDANLVATMLARGVPRLLTHNVGDFERFATLIELLPLRQWDVCEGTRD